MTAAAERAKVLVVDDTEGNRYSVSRLLRGAGFVVEEAATGAEALALALGQPDVVVLDVNLPDINGFEVARRLRSSAETALIPILHLSASFLREEDRAEGLDSGANYYLTHPVDPSVFIATVRSLVRVRRIEDELNGSALEWQATFDAIRDAVCVLDGDGTILRANRSARELFGADGKTVIGRGWAEAMSAAVEGLDRRLLHESVGAAVPVVHELRARDRWFRVVLDPIASAGRHRGALVAVVSEISERKRAERERTMLLESAEAARSEAEAANQAKSDFLATMSHEIRTPINAILGYAQILDMGIPGSISDEQRTHLDRLRASANHLLGLVNEVLDLAKVESGRMRVDSERGRLDDALEAALALTRPLASARGISLVDESAGHGSLAYIGDAGRVRQILVNLLSNAVKFTEPGGRVSVECESTERPGDEEVPAGEPWVAVHVVDTGIGIDSGHIARIFEPFVQGEMGRTRRRGGTGLGLTISRRLARLMGGEITTRSEPGKGSRFSLWLPAAIDGSEPTAELPIPTRAPVRRYDVRVLAAAGAELTECASELTHRLVQRIRAEPGFPNVDRLGDRPLADHYPSYLTDLFQALVMVADTDGDATALLRDGNAIRTLIAERHGAQRAALGWRTDTLEHEYDILLQETLRILTERVRGDAAEHAAELLRRLIDQTRAAALRGLRLAAGDAH